MRILGCDTLPFIYCHPVSSCCSLLVSRIGIWGDGFGTTFGGFWQFEAMSGGLRKPVVVIISKSKDRFMERPPMKTVQQWSYMGTAWCSMWYNLVWRTNRWCGLSGLSWDPPGWEWVGKGVVSPENHTVQEGALGDLDWHLRWNLSGYAIN
jgi:hypothetical protein